MLARFKALCLRKGVKYIVIAEQGYYASGLRKRMIVEISRPMRMREEIAAA